jgi:hypothetical protein
MSSFADSDVVVGMDVSKNTIVAGVLTGDGVPIVDSLSADEASLRRFFRAHTQPHRGAFARSESRFSCSSSRARWSSSPTRRASGPASPSTTLLSRTQQRTDSTP